ncbi:MAG: hypothetical protein ACN6O6_23930 [Pseudomonas sp.]|uniref:hypothetical protein n=1 Tax=Pseudomonas sp. TaxID=306 RepID=UPI003D1156A4
MDDLLGLLLRGIGYVLAEILFRVVFYFIGWPFVKAATLGRYPRKFWPGTTHQETYVCVVGLAVLVFGGLIILAVVTSTP